MVKKYINIIFAKMQKTVLIFLLFIVLLSCKNNENKNKSTALVYDTIVYPKAEPIDAEHAAVITKSVDSYVNQFLIPNNYVGGLLIAWKGNIIYERYAGNNTISGVETAMNSTTPVHIASTSKTFTAHLILLLHQSGKLQLTDTVQKFFPNFPYHGISIWHLLTHRSGLAKYDYFIEERGAKFTTGRRGRQKQIAPAEKFGFMLSNADVINYMDTAKPEMYKPENTGFQYNNTNYMLLASIAEKASGISFPKLMQDEIFGPLAMRHSYVASAADTLRNVRSKFKNGNLFPYTELDGTYGDKNVYSTARDMFKWHTYLQHKNKLRQSLIDSSYAGYSNEKPGIKNYGFGWRMFNLADSNKIIFHNGYWHGNNSCFTRLIKEDVVIISTGNRLCKQGYGMMSFTGFFGNYLGFEKDIENADSTANKNIDPEAANMQKFIESQIKPNTIVPIKAPALPPVKKDTAKMRLDSLRKDSILKLKNKS